MALNCPNCGAPIDNRNNVGKCDYCGTSYFDVSGIPLNEPFFLKINLGTRENPRVVTTKVYTSGALVTNTSANISINPSYLNGKYTYIEGRTPREFEFTFTELLTNTYN